MIKDIKTNVTTCFIGHRKIIETQELRDRLYKVVENLITENGVNVFLFGSKSQFNSISYETVSLLKEKYPHVKRIYARAEYPIISEDYEKYLLESFEETYYSERLMAAGKAVYVKRNFEMIEKSQFCIFYYNEHKAPENRKSGTQIAFNYATSKGKQIINLFK